ncbi:MAG: 2-C-methyl-D-erythritol 2,4-cyclodiphosphate synthase [Planctomycetota bacterium]|nr:2-C-methyl-D-erythritol 2,4-cyclodiphosphate synthase [Planctomycetota bacterium]
MRVGHGYDLHRLEPIAPAGAGRPLILGGVKIPHDRGPVAHSDGDVVLHAVVDALLGSLGEPDIGELFSNDDPRHDGADSSLFVSEAMRRVRARGYAVGNIDITVICERPRLSDHKAAMRTIIARLLGCEESRVNIKGKTHEGVDAIGEGRAVEAHVVVFLISAP